MLKVFLFSLLSFVLSISFIPLIIKFCKKFCIFDKINTRKVHSGNIPRLGGIGIFFALIISVIVFLAVDNNSSLKEMIPLLVAIGIVFIFGVLDDLIELNACAKLFFQSVAALIVIVAGFRFDRLFVIPLYGNLILRICSVIVTYCWIIGNINSFNLIDGIDGLCGSLSFMIFFTCLLIYGSSFIEGSAICALACAAIAGFLVFNFPPAKIFMGDSGSQTLGFLVSTLPLYLSYVNESYNFNKFLIVVDLGLIPLMDTIAAIWRRLRDHKPIMSPDKAHLHHKLMALGFTSRQVLLLLDLIQICICCIVFLSTKVSLQAATILLIILFCIVLFFFSLVHFLYRNSFRKKMANGEITLDS